MCNYLNKYTKVKKNRCVYGHPTHPMFQPPTLTFFIGNYSTRVTRHNTNDGLPEISKMKYRNRIPEPGTCYWSQWSVDKMVSYFIGVVMVSILALSVLDP